MNLRQEYLDHVKARGYAWATREKHKSYLDVFHRWLAGEGIQDARDVTSAVLDVYRLIHLKRRPHQRFRVIRAFFRWAAKAGHVLMDPSSGLLCPPPPRRLPDDVTEKEIETLLNQPDVNTRVGLRDRAIMELLYSTGIRRQEVARLTLGDVDAAQGVLHVRQGKMKKDRTLPLGKTALYWLDRYIRIARTAHERNRRRKSPGSYDAALFLSNRGKRLHPVTLSWWIKTYGKRCGLSKTVTCYRFRHSFATHLMRGGANIVAVQKMLGHGDLCTTQIYTHVAPLDLKAAHKKSHPRG